MEDYNTLIEDLTSRRAKLKDYYIEKKTVRDRLKKNKSKLEKEALELDKDIDKLEKVRILLHKTSEYARAKSKQQIEQLVTSCLQHIFDTELIFTIEIAESRNRPEAEFYVISNISGEKIKTRPQESRGGGVVDIVSLALRISMMEIANPKIVGPIILDEPVKHLSDEYIMGVANFLKHVSRLFNRQIIMVTHNSYLSEVGDNVYRVELNEGVSLVDRLK